MVFKQEKIIENSMGNFHFAFRIPPLTNFVSKSFLAHFFALIYLSQRHDLPASLKIITHNFQKFPPQKSIFFKFFKSLLLIIENFGY